MNQFTIQQKFFLLLLTLVTIAFGWILLPYSGAVFWGMVLGILFAPLYRRLLPVTKQKPTVAALLTLFSIIVMVILPLSLIGASLVRQALGIYDMIGSGQIDFGRYFQQIVGVLPEYITASAYRVRPVVALVTPPFDLTADPGEVAEIFEVPLAFLMNGAHHQRMSFDLPEGAGRRSFYAMPYERFFIWGATAGMLRNVFQFLRA